MFISKTFLLKKKYVLDIVKNYNSNLEGEMYDFEYYNLYNASKLQKHTFIETFIVAFHLDWIDVKPRSVCTSVMLAHMSLNILKFMLPVKI